MHHSASFLPQKDVLLEVFEGEYLYHGGHGGSLSAQFVGLKVAAANHDHKTGFF